MIGRGHGNASRLFAHVALLGLVALCQWPASGLAARGSHPVCVRRGGAPQSQCPRVTKQPRLVLLGAGSAVSPVLVGNSYAVDGGRWSAVRPARLSVEWLDGHRHRLARSVSFAVTPTLVGQVVAARVCVSTQLAVSCLVLRLPGPVRTPAQYLQASCGARRPPPPPYDPNFVLLSAPQVTHGWNPCRVDVWAIDTYGEPPLLDALGASWEGLIAQALAQASAATGIVFERSLDFVAPPGAAAEQQSGVTLTISFAPLPPNVDGLGGPTTGAGAFAVTGGVKLDSQKAWQTPEAITVLLHEIGHALGLGHPVPPAAPAPENEIMDSRVSAYTSYQPGDLCGLFEVTWQQPCAGTTVVMPGQGTAPSPGSG